MSDQQLGTVVIGGSQAGLAVGYYLKQHGLPFVILDENDRIGHAWLKRWDSLRLFTPGRYDALPGMPFPGSPSSYPTKDETADYLERYAREFELPVRTGVKVERLLKVGDRFEVICGERTVVAANVVVATGAYHNPRIPPFARELDESIVQLHSNKWAMIPGSMGTRSYIVVGKEHPMSFQSAPHGAGRRYSRTKARALFGMDDLSRAMAGIEYRHSKVLLDEIPAAYKNIDEVMEHARDLVEVKYVLQQFVNVKGD